MSVKIKKPAKQCNCIGEFEKKLVGQKNNGKDIMRAEFVSSGFMFSTMTRQATGEMELTVVNGKRPVKQSVVYNYCPFCGKKYPESKQQ